MNIIKKLNKAENIWEVIASLKEEDLEEIIEIAADSYYNQAASLISDDIYDILVDKLRKINPDSPVLKKIGAPIKGKKVKLPYWMGSMDKIKSDDAALQKWISEHKGPYVVSDKLDGISCLLVANDGKISLYTRGDGSHGQDISHLIDYINVSIAYIIKKNKDVAIRGELIMTKKNFEKYEDEMSNARNMVGGIVNSKKDSLNTNYANDVDFVSYEIIKPRLKPSIQMETLVKWRMNTVHYKLYDEIDLDILDNLFNKRREKSQYEVDGIIVTDDHEHPRNKSGNPPYSFAYKGVTPTADAKVIEVLWKASKDGYLNPRVHYEKTRISGADLEYATGFNAKFIKDNKIGPGAIITVIRSGDVIPYIIGVVKDAEKGQLPDDLDYKWDKNKVHIILEDHDKNETVIIQRLIKFVKEIGVENVSEGIITRLVENGYDSIIKIMSLTLDDLLALDGFKKTLASKIMYSLKKQLGQLDILKLMSASNCFGRGFGEKKIRKILDVYPNIIDRYEKSKRKQWEENLLRLEGFDQITATKFLDYLPDFQKFYKKASQIIEIRPYIRIVSENGLFKNQTIVFTGFRDKDLQEFVEKEGGKVSGSVSKNTTLVVYKDGEETSSKYQKAKKLGITTISKSLFVKKHNKN